MNNIIEESTGYNKLKNTILNDSNSGRSEEERMKKLTFAVTRAKHYEEKTGVSAIEILDKWESKRTYWYMNYYQDANQPLIESDKVKVFDTIEDLKNDIEKLGFRCPNCSGISKSPYECTSGIKLPLINSNGKNEVCNWKVYGLFGHLGKGVTVFVKSELAIENMFMPIAWEK